MEVLPRNDAHHDGESECTEHVPETTMEQVRTEINFNGTSIQLGDYSEEAFYDFDVEGRNPSYCSHDSEEEEDNDLEKGDEFALENVDMADDTVESGGLKNNQGGSSYSKIKDIEPENPQAVWVKWRGKWEPGIKCARVDWPLTTLKAKPTHDRKQYLVIFFPRTRNYSWADVLLIRSIHELPQPIAYTSHVVGVKMVRNLNVARRFIMQKLAVAMLNILDQLNREALIETARDVSVMKDFALEVSRCKDYSDLGGMLLKLQSMILPRCLKSEWLQKSLQFWKQQCRNANRAECIGNLKEELAESIIWNEVNIMSSQVDLGSDWKSWKQEVMKLFSVSNPSTVSLGSEQSISDSLLSLGNQIARKRPKLEVRRPDAHAPGSQQSCSVEPESTYDSKNSVNDSLMAESPCGMSDKWDGIMAESENVSKDKANDMEMTTPITSVAPKFSDLGSHNRQCAAFIEAKGRQCVRFANDGEVYCCVHLASRFRESSAKSGAVHSSDSTMCGGTTVLGTKCKHRALSGSSFCKKHRPQDGKDLMLSVNSVKRKLEETQFGLENKGFVKHSIYGENKTPVHLDRQLSHEKGSVPETIFNQKAKHPQEVSNSDESAMCVGMWPHGNDEACLEIPVRHSLYCEKHIPNWLKRARNGKSRIISKEVFLDLLRTCRSRERKLQLHQACEQFYRFFKSVLSLRNPVPKETQFQQAIIDASKDDKVGQLLMKLVSMEKERLMKLWSFSDDDQKLLVEDFPVLVHTSNELDQQNIIKCKLCSEKFSDDQLLGTHWMDSHKKEAQWLFRGYVCAICLDSFTNKKVLESHVQQRHHVEFVENCMLLQCIPCGSHFGNAEELWLHVLSVHPCDLRLPKNDAPSWKKVEPSKQASVEHVKSENQSGKRRFICRFCGLKFDLLPDLGRHHQAAHMGQTSAVKNRIQFYSHKMKSGRLNHPRFKKIRNKRIPSSNSVDQMDIPIQASVPEGSSLGRLADSQCSAIAKILISEMRKTISRPGSSELLATARSACCKVSLRASLESKHGLLPEKVHLKAAKLCSEQNILIDWHRDSWICPKGCQQQNVGMSPPLSSIIYSSEKRPVFRSSYSPSHVMTSSEWTMDESHCVIDSQQFSVDLSEKNIVLCDDISFGQESVPIACVMDENLLNAEEPDGQMMDYTFPWESFTYTTKSLLHQSLVLEPESSQLGCTCEHASCSSNACDHVYLFSSDYADAKDVYGNSMQGRSPYDERGRIILEEGYLVYECNQRCCCRRDCPNRVLQIGVTVKLEIFKTDGKGWAVRAREAILRGTFVCEYIGEVIDENESNERRKRYGEDCSRYFYEIDSCINNMSRLVDDEQASFVIDATNYGNISRYINHSCSSNLVNHQVLVESMDSRLSHFGFYASRDIAMGEELTYDFHYKLEEGEGRACLCGSSNCRGRLY